MQKERISNMKRQIRKSTFETNSSSTHAICISKEKVAKGAIPSFVKFNHGEFGWMCCRYDTVSERASYLYQAICDLYYEDSEKKSEHIDSLRSVLSNYGVECEFEGEFESIDNNSYEWENGYVDHAEEAREFVDSVMDSDDLLIRYLFGNSVIITGNDNDDSFDKEMSNNDFKNYQIFYKWN